MAIEPLAELIRANLAIEGLMINRLEEKVLLYTDDMFIYLADSQSSLYTLLQIIQRFGCFLGFLVNWEKSLLWTRTFQFPFRLYAH